MSSAVPCGNGKSQPWKQVWPPRDSNLAGVAETRGQMLLLDGTGGSGTTAVPNSVTLPPKPQEQQSNGEAKEGNGEQTDKAQKTS